jgi:hypothetical protein
MLKPRKFFVPVVLVTLPATVLLGVQASLAELNGCRTKPGSSARPGTHWSYRVSPRDNQRCWFLSHKGVKARLHAGDGASPTASARPTLQRENGADPARAQPYGAEAPRVQHTEVTPAQVIPSKTAAQIASAQGASAEGVSLVTSVGEHETSIDFAARWPDLPKSLDLDGRSLATMSNAYAGEQADGSEQLPSVPSESEGMAAFMSAAPRLRWCLCCCLPARFSCSPAGVNRIIAIIGVRLHTGDAHASSCDLISPRWPVGRRRERGTTVRFGNRRRRPIRPVTSRRVCGNSWATCNGPGRRVARFGHSHRLRIVAPLIPDAS